MEIFSLDLIIEVGKIKPERCIIRAYIFLSLTLAIFAFNAVGQDLLGERIRRITSRKKSIYLDKGIFHNGGPSLESNLKSLRHSYNKSAGYERIVFDFSTKKIPKIYGYINSNGKNLYVDFFDTKISKEVGSFGKTKYVKSVNFFPISKENLSLELKFKEKVSVDVFFLENPGRLVIDIKN